MAVFRVIMKTPDALEEMINEAALSETDAVDVVDEEEREELFESHREKITKACKKWFKYGEFLEVEVDTDAGTCVVIPCK